MDDVTAILNKLRAAAGFGEGIASQRDLDVIRKRPNPQAVAQLERVNNWAGSDQARWKLIHAALLHIYSPAWDRVDARDILVAWAAAWLASTQARHQLARFEGLQRPLTTRERDAKGGIQADVSFWERLASRLQTQVAAALTEDAEASRLLGALVDDKKDVNK